MIEGVRRPDRGRWESRELEMSEERGEENDEGCKPPW
jgi:hypothetical protein